MNIMEDGIGGIALKHFDDGLNCAESVLLAMCARLGVSSGIVPAVATGLGAGMGRRGRACGAFTGAIMAMGLKLGRTAPEDDKDTLYAAVGELESRFMEKFGDVDCLPLIGFDIRSDEGLAAARASGVFKTTCRELVRFAADTAAELTDA